MSIPSIEERRKIYINSNWLEWLTIILIFGFLSILISLIITLFEENTNFTLEAYFESGVLLFFCLGVIGNTLYTNWHGIMELGKFKAILIGSLTPIGISIFTAFIFKELRFKIDLNGNPSENYWLSQVAILTITIICISVVKRNALKSEFNESEVSTQTQMNLVNQKQTLISFKGKLKEFILRDDYSGQNQKKFKNALFELRDELDDVINKI